MLEIFYTAEFDSPIGRLKVASSKLGLAYLELPRAAGRGFFGWLDRHAPGAKTVADHERNLEAVDQTLEFLAGDRKRFELKLDIRATEFQEAVYGQVASIPYGESRSYGAIAGAIGRPKAVRAVGAANGANPIPLVIPCHRVIASSGNLQGYAGGLETKAKLLALERQEPSTGWLL